MAERVAAYVHTCHHRRAGSWRLPVSAGADRWIRWTTIGCGALLALIAGTVSYLHMHMLVARHGQPGWVATLTPLSVDGMIVAASTTLLADSRSGRRGGVLPWALLVAGSVTSLVRRAAVGERQQNQLPQEHRPRALHRLPSGHRVGLARRDISTCVTFEFRVNGLLRTPHPGGHCQPTAWR